MTFRRDPRDSLLRQIPVSAIPRVSAIGHGVAVAGAGWKVAVVLAPGQGSEAVTPSTRVLAAIMPNVDGIAGQPWATYRTSIADVEQRSGYLRRAGKAYAAGTPDVVVWDGAPGSQASRASDVEIRYGVPPAPRPRAVGADLDATVASSSACSCRASATSHGAHSHSHSEP